MKLIVKTLLIIVVVGTMVSCKSTFNRLSTTRRSCKKDNDAEPYANDGIRQDESYDGK